MYSDRYQASIDIFQSIPYIEMGKVTLRGFILEKINMEAKFYLQNSSDKLVKKYLPKVYVSNENEAKKVINELIDRFIFKACIPFTIAEKERKFPIGYVLCNSPLLVYEDTKTPMNEWTIDFWINEEIRNYGICSAAVWNVLLFLKRMLVKEVYAFVDKENTASIRVLEKCGMYLHEEVSNKKMWKYKINLETDI